MKRSDPYLRHLERVVRRLERDGHHGFADELRQAIASAEAATRNAPPAESHAGRCHQFSVSDPSVAGPTVSVSEGDSGVRRDPV